MSPSPVQRVKVTGPPVQRRTAPSVAAQLDEQNRLGAVYLRSLIRSQLRLALGITVVLGATIGLLPLVFSIPLVQHARVHGVPVAWPVLGVGAYPVLLLLARAYVSRAERNERAFHALVDPGEAP